ncbi:hypothetical protein KM043_004000 [Ampulex compressa]|nr:hypothetical protein KM043_004000 [Ampulex compressa]
MATNMCMQNCTQTGSFLYDMLAEDIWMPWNVLGEYFVYTPWLFSLLGSTMVGLAGIFPLLVIPFDEGADLKNEASAGTLKILLSFAVGGLLGDVFLHLLPEAWENESLKRAEDAGHPSMACGLWVLSGFLVFVIVEKIFAFDSEGETEEASFDSDLTKFENVSEHRVDKEMENNNCITLIAASSRNGFSKRHPNAVLSKDMTEVQPFLEGKTTKNGYAQLPNGYKDTGKNGFVRCNEYPNGAFGAMSIDRPKDRPKKPKKANGFAIESNGCPGKTAAKNSVDQRQSRTAAMKEKPKHITGYLNLLANIIDNFTHGLAVGGSFLVSFRLGALTTFAILIHEIPHEVGDFAILLRSGFSRWDAARAQLLTASGGILGALAAVLFSGGVEARTSWILPFTSGGFLHIGMVTILPELLKETNPKESLKQLGALLFGIAVMAVLTVICD